MRLKLVLERVIPGRVIFDNVLITHEVLHYLKTSNATKRCSIAVKTDISKAYDRLEWDFLQKVLSRMGFHDIYTNWVMHCITTVSYSFLINKEVLGSVIPSLGIRQGNPISPYLFILCAEVLSRLCRKAQTNMEMARIIVARHFPRINHFLFADDTMFFTRSDPTSCLALTTI